ncbi:MAG: RNA methyltransferase [Chlamydiia bacterium]|nr:RNA methyltransferase [Chlamydiia bacterium]
MAELTSLQNPKVKAAIALRDSRDRKKTGLYLIEGYRENLRASDAGTPFVRLFYCPELFLGENEPALIEAIKTSGAEVLSCSKSVFEKLSYRDRPDGLLTVAEQNPLSLEHLKNPNFLVVAEAIEKPGNLGTILRSSDAVGVDGVIVADRCTDIYNPNVVRASVGTLFTRPVIEAKTDEILAYLKQNGIKIVSTTPYAEKEYTDVDLTVPIAIAVGTEQLGLSDKWLEAADIKVKIPMLGVADSLNVATATTLVLYEALRQRRQ